MKPKRLLFAPRGVFDKILEYTVIPTFDLIVWFDDKGVILVRRKIAPYKNTWALPGLRMMKPEGIDDTLARIAQNEIGVSIDPMSCRFIGQYVGRFRSENNRQDLSTCYAVKSDCQDISVNKDHFSSHHFVKSKDGIPNRTGSMYRHFLNLFFGSDHLDRSNLNNQTESGKECS